MNEQRDNQHRDDNRRKWHVEKSINVGHVLTTLSLALAAVIYATTMDKRVTVLESQQSSQASTQRDTDTKQDQMIAAVREDLKEISRKLDRLIERTYSRKE